MKSKEARRQAQRHLPMKPIPYLILLAVSRGVEHGYAMRTEVAGLSEGTVRLDPGTLYRWLARLLQDGLIEESTQSDESSGDPRRRNYQLTDLGREIMELESTRLSNLVRAAQRQNLVRERS